MKKNSSTSPYQRIRYVTYDLLHAHDKETRAEHFVRITLSSLIVLSIISVMLETVHGIEEGIGQYLYLFEVFTVVVFSLEYVLRFWSIVEEKKYSDPFWGRLRYTVSFFALIDLLAVLPFFIPQIISMDLRFIRGFRLVRLFRVLKLGHYSTSLGMIVRVVKKKKHEIAVVLFTVGITLVISSSLMYFLEHDTQPEAFSSIPAALWWGVAALTTVGYGDVVPATVLGKVFGSVICILGVGLFALPSGILVAGFVEEMQTSIKKITCPRCGEEISHQ